MHRIHAHGGAPAALVALLVAGVLLLAACGGDGGSSSATTGGAAATVRTARSNAVETQGAQVFASAGCASCHTLKAAGASGNTGPNLDQLQPSKQAVVKIVTTGGGGMPSFKNQLSAGQINAVATYVSSVAGK